MKAAPLTAPHPWRTSPEQEHRIILTQDHHDEDPEQGVTGLVRAERFARALLAHTPHAAAFVFDAELTLRFAEGDALRRQGYETRVIVGRRAADILSPAAWTRLEPHYRRVLAGEEFIEDYEAAIGRSYRLHGSPVRTADGRIEGGLLVSHEVVTPVEERLTARLQQQTAVADLGSLAITTQADLGELIKRATELVVEALAAACCSSVVQFLPGEEMFLVRLETTGESTGRRLPLAGSLAQRVRLAKAPVVLIDAAEDSRQLPQPLVEKGVRSAACVAIGALDRPFGVLSAFAFGPGAFEPDDVAFLSSLANVVAEAARREESDAVLRRQALHDVVTGLPNRTLLDDRLRQALVLARRADLQVGVLFVDLDHFKVVNDSLGHQAGDEVLREVSRRLCARVRASDTVARFGGDEFVVVAPALQGQQDAVRLAEGVLAALAEPIEVDGQPVHVGGSVGIALAGPNAEVDPGTLLGAADAAMYRAKELGRNRYALDGFGTGHHPVDVLRVEQDLRRAMPAGELRLAYQPFVRLEDGSPFGAEVLLRWQHPQKGLVGPDHFLESAERSRLIIPIGEWMLREACRHAARWQRRWDFLVTVNLSFNQLADTGIVDGVARALDESGLPPDRLGLELTEQVLIGDEQEAVRTLTRLKALGVRLLLDDFGTGFSSLSHLKRFPIDIVKVDRSFVSGLGVSSPDGDAAIVAAIIGMSSAIGKQVIAEGIETAEQADELLRMGCRFGQGYRFARPLSREALERWMSERP